MCVYIKGGLFSIIKSSCGKINMSAAITKMCVDCVEKCQHSLKLPEAVDTGRDSAITFILSVWFSKADTKQRIIV